MYTVREVMKMYTILVCDDDKEIVEAIEIYLTQEGYHLSLIHILSESALVYGSLKDRQN